VFSMVIKSLEQKYYKAYQLGRVEGIIIKIVNKFVPKRTIIAQVLLLN